MKITIILLAVFNLAYSDKKEQIENAINNNINFNNNITNQINQKANTNIQNKNSHNSTISIKIKARVEMKRGTFFIKEPVTKKIKQKIQKQMENEKKQFEQQYQYHPSKYGNQIRLHSKSKQATNQCNALNPFKLGTLLSAVFSQSIKKEGEQEQVRQISFRTRSSQDQLAIINKYKVYCGERYIADDIGAYLEGGKEKCLCNNRFYVPGDYRQLEMKFQQSNRFSYSSLLYQKYELLSFDNLQSLMQQYGGVPGPDRFRCYISFDKNDVQNDINSNYNLIKDMKFGYPYDILKTAKLLRTGDGFYFQLEAYDRNDKAIGLQMARKLEFDAFRLGCLQKCNWVDQKMSYDSRLEYAEIHSNGVQKLLELQEKFNERYYKTISQFYKSHQAVLVIDEYCVKISKVLKFAEIVGENTIIDIDESFYRQGSFKQINLDGSVSDDDKCVYRLVISLNTRCIFTKWFGQR